MAQFILMLHENPAMFAELTPEEMQQLVARYGAWGKALAEKGHYVGGHKLTDEGGRQMRKANGALGVTDGPYSEVKEVIGGLFIVEATKPRLRTSLRKASLRPPSAKLMNVVCTESGSDSARPSICRSGPPKKVLDVR